MAVDKYITNQTRKMLSAYGGVGSILETPKGALIVEEFDKWKFFKDPSRIFEREENIIEDNRLLKRLQVHFKYLRKFIRVPENVSNAYITYEVTPSDDKKVASANYFPEWMYCPNCERFKHINDWWKGWYQTLEHFKEIKAVEKFIKPKCYKCYEEAKLKNKWKKYFELEQVRFIMTAPNGNIRDLPWDRWNLAEKNINDESADGGNIRLDFTRLCCDSPDLRYLRSETFSDLAGIRIKCVNKDCSSNGREVTLAGLFGLRIGQNEKQFKPVIRTSNSVYYPICINSIYLPKKIEEISNDDKIAIRNSITAGLERNKIYIIFNRYSKETIDDFIDNKNDTHFEPEIQYRFKEYKFILENPNYNDEENKSNLRYENQDITSLKNCGINTLIKVKRLRLTTVQTAYTRQEPLDKDLFIREGDSKTPIKIKYTSTQGINTQYLLAAESFGEGIFIDLNKNKVDEWFSKHYNESKSFKDRIDLISKRIIKSDFLSKEKFSDNKHLAKYILIHTLSHLLIKELEFLCGYSSTSLNERLFVDSNNMQGVLIYTVAGSEGSYGGLIKQSNPQSFKKILQSALFRCNDCASDPVCYHSDGQGIGGLNLAACYSCSLLPETSCEDFNCFLDRAILIDEQFGYFGEKLTHNLTKSNN
uniref:MrfA-like Zn-binding domain-containing protein n=1 Tax=Ignavibacterium album TaxID=591197 RepID=A0A7V2ZKR1_9BACT